MLRGIRLEKGLSRMNNSAGQTGQRLLAGKCFILSSIVESRIQESEFRISKALADPFRPAEKIILQDTGKSKNRYLST